MPIHTDYLMVLPKEERRALLATTKNDPFLRTPRRNRGVILSFLVGLFCAFLCVLVNMFVAGAKNTTEAPLPAIDAQQVAQITAKKYDDNKLETIFATYNKVLSDLTSAIIAEKTAANPQNASAESLPTTPANNMMVGTVLAKANLRLGPGTEHSVAMVVSPGTTLVIEEIQASWYRVLAPTGERLFIERGLIALARPQSN